MEGPGCRPGAAWMEGGGSQDLTAVQAQRPGSKRATWHTGLARGNLGSLTRLAGPCDPPLCCPEGHLALPV